MNESEFTIKEVTSFSPTIAESMRTLSSQLGTHYKELTDADLLEMIQSPMHTLFIAIENKSDRVVGMILLLVYRIPYLRKAHLDDLTVDEGFRHYGIGTALLQKATEVAREKGVTYVDFSSRVTRGPANNLYQKLGYEQHDTNVYRLYFDYEKA